MSFRRSRRMPYDRSALAQIDAGSFEIHYDTFRAHSRQISNVDARQTISVQEKALSVKNIFTVMRNQAGLNSTIHDTHYAKNAIIEYQWKIGNEYYPAQPVRCDDGGVRALTQLRDALSATSDVLQNGQLDSNTYCPESHTTKEKTINFFPVYNIPDGTDVSVLEPYRQDRRIWEEVKHQCSLPNKFIIGQSFEKSQGQLSGFNTVESQVDIELIVTLASHQQALPNSASSYQQSKLEFQPLKAPVNLKGLVANKPIEGTRARSIRSAAGPVVLDAIDGKSQGLTYYMRENA